MTNPSTEEAELGEFQVQATLSQKYGHGGGDPRLTSARAWNCLKVSGWMSVVMFLIPEFGRLRIATSSRLFWAAESISGHPYENLS